MSEDFTPITRPNVLNNSFIFTPRSVVTPPVIVNNEVFNSNSLIAQRVVPNQSQVVPVPKNLPLANTQQGSWFKDRFDPTLIWYLPSFKLVDDPDKIFAFVASQSNIPDDQGNPFNTCSLSLGLKKIIPDDVIALMKGNSSGNFREIPLNNLSISLDIVTKDSKTGQDEKIVLPCCLDPQSNPMFLSINNIVGNSVKVLYENLVTAGTATLSISASYDVWQQQFHFKFNGGEIPQRPSVLSTLHIPPRLPYPSDPPILLPPPIPPAYYFEQRTLLYGLELSLGMKFAGDPYRLQFTLTVNDQSRPIINESDLSSYVVQSEFTELKILGNVGSRYDTIDRLYLGVLSREIVIIPKQYVIFRQKNACGALCNASIDSSSNPNANSSQFDFQFTLVADVSPIDILNLSQEIKGYDAIKDCELVLPKFLKNDSTNANLVTPFITSFQYLDAPGTFLLDAKIKDGPSGSGTPAVVNANGLIGELRIVNGPELAGILEIKLDDASTIQILIPVILNFTKTRCTEDIIFNIDEQSGNVILTSQSVFDLKLSRITLFTPNAITPSPEVPVVLSSGQTLSLPLPVDHTGLNIMIDSELNIQNDISKKELLKYLQFNVIDVQNAKYSLIVNGAQIISSKIDHIDVQISLTDLPGIVVPHLTLNNVKSWDCTDIYIPLNYAMGVLNSTVLCNVYFSDTTNKKFTVQNDFVQNPTLLLSNIPV